MASRPIPGFIASAGDIRPNSRWSNYAKPGPYVTKLPPEEENKFQDWVGTNKVPWQDTPTADYDMRGFYQAAQSGDPLAKRAVNLHYPDTYKTPYHSTFSNESQYALPTAGHWQGNTFVDPEGKLRDTQPEAPNISAPQSRMGKIFGMRK